jgi:hypothetical protein
MAGESEFDSRQEYQMFLNFTASGLDLRLWAHDTLSPG